MSGSRAYRRKLKQLRAERRVAFVLPELEEGMAPPLLNALERRRRASMTGTCACGAVFEFDRPLAAGAVVHATMAHKVDCTASDEGIANLIERYGLPS